MTIHRLSLYGLGLVLTIVSCCCVSVHVPDHTGPIPVKSYSFFELQLKEKMTRMKSVSVRIDVDCGTNGKGGGSGVVIASNRVLTAQHVVDHTLTNECSITVVTTDGREFLASTFKQDKDKDLALLDVEGYITGNTVYSSEEVFEGQPVYSAGWPRNMFRDDNLRTFSISKGVVANKTAGRYYRITAQSYFGGSGCGVFTEDGYLIGIFVGMMADPFNKVPFEGNYAIVPMSVVNDFLAS